MLLKSVSLLNALLLLKLSHSLSNNDSNTNSINAYHSDLDSNQRCSLPDDNNKNDLHRYNLNHHISICSDKNENNNLSTSSTDCNIAPHSVTYLTSSNQDKTSSISHDALFCNGGCGDSMIVSMAEYPVYDFDEDDSDQYDDDDEDDDGHGLMLSNASLPRSPFQAEASTDGNMWLEVEGLGDSGSRPTARKLSARRLSAPAFSRKGYSAFSSAVSLRGGGSPLESEFARKLLVSALVTLMYEGALGHLLEFMKIVMQTSPPGTSYWDIFRLITSEKGIGGMWDGFIPWGVVQSIAKGGVFGLAHSVALSFLLPLADSGVLSKQLAETLAGGIGGGFQGLVLSPTLLLKTRVMTNPVFREKMSLVKTTALSLSIGFDVATKEGLLALMKGADIFALKRVFDWSTRYYFYAVFENALAKHLQTPLIPTQKMTVAFVAGIASTISTLPLDVLVAKTQDAKKAGVAVSPFGMFQKELDEKGWSGIRQTYTSGFIARLLHVSFTTVAMKTGVPLLYSKLYSE